MRICPTCRTAYPARGRATCSKDGARLISAEEYAASQRDPLLGAKVAGRFVVKERIGTGGMGTVYRAEQIGLDRAVALKLLRAEMISDRDTVARFHREAKAMSLLMHPNTVRVFDFGEDDDGHLFLAMELLEGELLTAWLEREVTPPIDEAVMVVRAILRSLAEAHSKGIIHRDLKPDNIFLAQVEGRARPVVKVLDFGIAKVFREDRKIDQLETQAGTVFGTPRYMSPEQAQGSTLDHRSDVYAVGVLLYQLLTGSPPFMDDDAVIVMAKHIRDQPVPPRRAAPDRPIPRRLERALLKALAKEPDDRYENADAFQEELGACMPAIEEEAERMAGGRASGIFDRGGLGTPLLIGGAVIGLALMLALGLVLASGGDDVAAADDDVVTEITVPMPQPPPAHEVGAVGVDPPTEVEVTLTSTPPGASVFDGETELGRTPWSVALALEEVRSVTLRMDGYRASDVELTAAAAPERAVELVEAPATPPRPTGRRRTSAPDPGEDDQGDPYGIFD